MPSCSNAWAPKASMAPCPGTFRPASPILPHSIHCALHSLVRLGNTPCSPHHLNLPGDATGILVGGNLSVLYSFSGTYFDLDTRGKILFLEDLNEYLYHIDRMIMNLKLRGRLEGLQALIIGGMHGMKNICFGIS